MRLQAAHLERLKGSARATSRMDLPLASAPESRVEVEPDLEAAELGSSALGCLNTRNGALSDQLTRSSSVTAAMMVKENLPAELTVSIRRGRPPPRAQPREGESSTRRRQFVHVTIRAVSTVIVLASCSEAPIAEPDRVGTASYPAAASAEAPSAAAPGARPSLSSSSFPAAPAAPRPFGEALVWSDVGDLFAARSDGFVRLRPDGSEARLSAVAFDTLEQLHVTPDGRRLLAVYSTRQGERADIVDTATGTSRTLAPKQAIGGAMSDDGAIVAVGGYGSFTIVDGATGATLCESTEASLANGAFSADGTKLYATAVGGHGVIDVKSCSLLGGGGTDSGATSYSEVSPAGGLVAAAGNGGHYFELMRMDPFAPARRVPAGEVGCNEHFRPSFNRTGTLLFEDGFNTRFVVYDPSGRRIAKWQGDAAAPADELQGFEDGKRFVRVLSDRLEIRATSTGKLSCETTAVAGASALAISTDQTVVAVVSDGSVVLVEAATCAELARFSP
jgi:hypothetical protein